MFSQDFSYFSLQSRGCIQVGRALLLTENSRRPQRNGFSSLPQYSHSVGSPDDPAFNVRSDR